MNRTIEAFDALIPANPKVKALRALFDENGRAWFSFEVLVDLVEANKGLNSAIGYSDRDCERIAAAHEALTSATLEIADYIDRAFYEVHGWHTNTIIEAARKCAETR